MTALPRLSPDTRSCVWGVSGCGKSTLVRRFASDWATRRAVIVIDPNGPGDLRAYPRGWSPAPGLLDLSPSSPEDCTRALLGAFLASSQDHPITVICDEAPHYLKSPSTAVLRCFNQGRHRGLGVVVVGQRPSGVAPDVRANATTTIYMRLTDQSDLNLVSAQSRDLSQQVRTLETGQWVQWPLK